MELPGGPGGFMEASVIPGAFGAPSFNAGSVVVPSPNAGGVGTLLVWSVVGGVTGTLFAVAEFD